MQVTFWIYTLHGMRKEYNWETDSDKLVPCKIDSAVVNDPSDSLCIGGVDSNGKYIQFDSYEAYHADGYFCEKTNSEMCITSEKYTIPLDVLEKYKIS